MPRSYPQQPADEVPAHVPWLGRRRHSDAHRRAPSPLMQERANPR